MNAVTSTDTRTTEAAALPVADPSKHLLLLPLSQLIARRSKRNARTTRPRLSIPELAASLARVGLLQNLIVVGAIAGERYEVVAGDRRLTALKLLAKRKRLAADYLVPCLWVPDASARTVSLAENLLREQMHPADQFEAFAALVKEGRPVEDIAADFGVSPLVVQRRLKLANVSPRLLTDYRAGEVTLEQLMALAVTDDHTAQEAVFYGAPDWQRQPAALRERLTEREIDATHARVRFVGLEAYTAAGGGLRRDLFAEGESGTYLTDAALLEALVRAKLDELAGAVRAEGWAWVDAVPHLSHAERDAFQNAPREQRPPNARQARRLASLQTRLDKLDAALEQAGDAEDDEKAAALEQRCDQLAAERQALEDTLHGYASNVRAVAGAVITLDRAGEAVIHRGLLREAEAKALRTLQRVQQGLAGGEAANEAEGASDASKPADVSDRLAQRLSAHRTAALQIEVARHPQVALAALVHDMVQSVLQDDYGERLPLGVRLTAQDRLESYAPDVAESPAAVALREMRQRAGDTLPEEGNALLTALLDTPQDELVRLLALCVAATVDVVTPRADAHPRGAALAQAVGLDMAAWWQPTGEGYFAHLRKAAILDAVEQFAPTHTARLAKLKKGDIASEAGRLAEGSGWMPALFKAEAPPPAAPEGVAQDAPTEAEAMAA